jgi:hypothetical protein
MTKFNPENKETLTYGDCLSPAMKITDPEDAHQYFTEYVKHIQKYLDIDSSDNNMTAEDIAKLNLGYFAGYYDNETRKRVEKLFMCAHPIFGSIKNNGAPTPEEAFKMGFERSKNQI